MKIPTKTRREAARICAIMASNNALDLMPHEVSSDDLACSLALDAYYAVPMPFEYKDGDEAEWAEAEQWLAEGWSKRGDEVSL